jgi:hypothetical protein
MSMGLSAYRWDVYQTDYPFVTRLGTRGMVMRLQFVPVAHCCLHFVRLVGGETKEAKWLSFLKSEFITL